MVNGHRPSVHGAALTALDLSVGRSSAIWSSTSGDGHLASSKHNSSPTATALDGRSFERILKSRLAHIGVGDPDDTGGT